MGLLMSDTLLIDPMLHDAGPWLSSLSEAFYGLDAPLDDAEEEPAGSTERARLTPALLRWPKTLMACLRS